MRDAEDVSYMAYLEDVFYWINLGHSFFEEVDPRRDIHVHRFAPKAESSHTALVLCDIRSQPTPIPLTPVRNLEALFGSDSVYVKWEPPSSVSHRGRGAWQNWSYHIQIGDIEREISVSENDINTTEIKLNVLRPNTTYSIVVQPASDYDRRYAPLRPISSDSGHVVSISAYFFGKTLPNGEELRPIYWATNDGAIYQSSSVGENVREFSGVNFSLPYREQKNPHGVRESMVVINMAWMNDSIYVVTNTNRVYHIDLSSRNITIMEGLEASSVATDWLSRKLYWSSTNRQTVSLSSKILLSDLNS
jgi:proto-oncogene tyrosine-protein kinase ROS